MPGVVRKIGKSDFVHRDHECFTARPSLPPCVTGDPAPTEIDVPNPSPVMIGDPTPLLLLLVGVPVPAVIVGIDPMPYGVGSPFAIDARGKPHLAPPGVLTEFAIRLERKTEF